MSALPIDGKDYVSSKEAAESCGYTQDYVGQLARGGHIDARRVSGLWYVYLPSLQNYRSVAESYVPEPPQRRSAGENADSIITFDGKDYIAAARAAKLTGYHQDYVGQLARSGAILSRQIGNRWYVEREGILDHKRSKDALLGAVQSEAVGIRRSDTAATGASPEPFYRYLQADAAPLIPLERHPLPTLPQQQGATRVAIRIQKRASGSTTRRGPAEEIRRIPAEILDHKAPVKRVKLVRQTDRKTISYGLIGVGYAAALIIAAGAGYFLFGGGDVNGLRSAAGSPKDVAASTVSGVTSLVSSAGGALEGLVVPQQSYKRQ